ncbi:hypothetical protein CCP3SC1_2010001 [Gammaproteobacteria bacterium]
MSGNHYGTGSNLTGITAAQVGALALTGTLTSLVNVNSGSNSYFIGAGNVGIGTTAPSAKLDVVGTINASSVYAISGRQVLFQDPLSNVGVGFNALGPGLTGAANTAVGANALSANVSGTSNVAFGSEALKKMDGSMNNVAIGTQAGSALTLGDRNIFIGFASGLDNALPARNTTTGTSNIFIGAKCQGTSSSGSNLLNIGKSIYGTGLYGPNTAKIGINTDTPQAILHVVSAIPTAPFRVDAMDNTGAIQAYALFVDTSGNVGIGDKTQSNAILPNSSLFVSSTTTGSPVLVVMGKDWNGKSTAVSGNYMIVNCSGNVGIGTATPSVTLEVAGSLAARVIGTEDEFHITRPAVGPNAPSVVAAFALGRYGAIAAVPQTRLDINLKAAGGADFVATQNVMTLLDKGLVGIGTQAPDSTLEVSSNVTAGGPYGMFAVGGANSTALMVSSNGSVGIGTTDPNTSLEVIGGVSANYFSGNGAPANAIKIDSNGYVGIGLGASVVDDALHVSVNNAGLHLHNSVSGDDGWVRKYADRLQINASDAISLGLGSSVSTNGLWMGPFGDPALKRIGVCIGGGIGGAPTHSLEVLVSENANVTMNSKTALMLVNLSQTVQTSGAPNSVGIQFGQFAGAYPSEGIFGDTYGYNGLSFYTGSNFVTPTMRIDGGFGTVGIGPNLTSPYFPSALLTLNKMGAPMTITGSAEYIHLGTVEYAANSYRLIGFGYTNPVYGANPASPAYMGYQETNSTGLTWGDLVFGTRPDGSDVAPTERMRIKSTGMVGIGTTGPTDKLSVVGSVKVTGNLTITGAISKGSGTFDILHPDPVKRAQGWHLRHSFVESPTRGDNLYRWAVTVVNGQAVIALPDYFKYLNENEQVWITPKGHFGQAYGDVNEAQTELVINANVDGVYNVLVVGTRKDDVAKRNFDPLGIEYK